MHTESQYTALSQLCGKRTSLKHIKLINQVSSAVKEGFTLRFGLTGQIQMPLVTVYNGYMTSPAV